MFTSKETQVINEAKAILASKLSDTDCFTTPDAVKVFCQLQLSTLNHEVFAVMFLDNRHQMIEFVKMFRGTIDGASVYPREVAIEALAKNAAAVIFAHNHPSNVVEPSAADQRITERLVSALSLLDIRVLDHIIVGKAETTSFAERGLL